MTDKELYRQKVQARLDEWQAEIDKIKAQAAGANAEAQLAMNREIKARQDRIDEGKATLSELTQAGEGAWETIKETAEAAWDSTRAAVGKVAAKLSS